MEQVLNLSRCSCSPVGGGGNYHVVLSIIYEKSREKQMLLQEMNLLVRVRCQTHGPIQYQFSDMQPHLVSSNGIYPCIKYSHYFSYKYVISKLLHIRSSQGLFQFRGCHLEFWGEQLDQVYSLCIMCNQMTKSKNSS